jgi:hypothetical protein
MRKRDIDGEATRDASRESIAVPEAEQLKRACVKQYQLKQFQDRRLGQSD